MSSNITDSANSKNKSPDKFFLKSKIKTFRKLDRRGSIYNLIKEAKSLKTPTQELSQKKISSPISSHPSSEMESDSSIPNDVKQFKLNLKEDNNVINTSYFKHRYKQSELPILTTSEQILNEVELINKRDKYYKKI